MEFINVYMDNRGLWSASLCKDVQEIENIGGSYPKARSAELDAKGKWGRKLEVKMSYTPMFYSEELKKSIVSLLSEGFDTTTVAKKLSMKPPQVRAIKAHLTRGTYDKFEKEIL